MRFMGQELDTKDIQNMVTWKSKISHKDEFVNFVMHLENLQLKKNQIVFLFKSQILHEWQIYFMTCACNTR